MSGLRGVRCISRIGSHTIRSCRSQQQQKRLLSVALPAISQRILKSAYQDAIISPVNKYDLSGSTGVLSSTCSALFSTVTDSLTDEASSSLEESDSEAGKECRWPSPVHQHQNSKIIHSNAHSIFAGGYNFDHREFALKEIFSQFGPVIEIVVPNLRMYNQTPATTETYRFAFVRFREASSVERALEAKTVTTKDGHQIEIKKRFNNENDKKDLLVKRSVVIKNLPAEFTVQKCIELFGNAGDLRIVNVVFNGLMQRFNEKSFAFLIFQQPPDIAYIQSLLPSISDDIQLEEFKISRKQPPRNRSQKIFIEDIPDELSRDDITSHFGSFGTIIYSKLFDKKVEQTSGRSAIIEFDSNNIAMKATEELHHEINGSKIIARCLGWRKE